MKKIPTLFKREYDENGKVIGIINELSDPTLQCVIERKCIGTVKFDGSCCAIIDGYLYKRFDAKSGRTIPNGAIPCGLPDKITGHWPHWVKIDANNGADKWFIEAFKDAFNDKLYFETDGTIKIIDDSCYVTYYNIENIDGVYKINAENDYTDCILDGTYEAIGKHFNGNPYRFNYDTMIKHGIFEVSFADLPENEPLSFEFLKDFLYKFPHEGIVFWSACDNGNLLNPICKIKRSDFGYKWPL